MGLKLLHTADWHLDSPFGSLPERLRGTMRENQRRIPDMIADICTREQCDLVLLAGDVFDGKASRESITLLQRALERCRVPVVITPGNHDFCCPDSPWLTERWPENVHIFTGELDSVDFPELDCRIYGGGFRGIDCLPLLEGFRAAEDVRWRIGVLHGDPIQQSSPCCPVTAAQVRDSGLDYLALGHIHRAGSFRAGATLCGWPGCPMGRGWDETGEKGIYLVELGETAEIIPVALPLPGFYELKAEADELDGILPPTQSEDCYRVTLTGTEKPNLTEIRRRFSHLALLELRDETEAETDFWGYAGDDSLRGVYTRLLQQQLAGVDPEQAKIILLAAEISRKLLEGREVELP